MINIWAVIILLFLHWLGDFVLQTDAMARGKSISTSFLLEHTAAYSLVFLMVCAPAVSILNSPGLVYFAPVTFVVHTIQDYFTSRINKRFIEAGENHEYYVCMGLDQLFHLIQLILTYKMLA